MYQVVKEDGVAVVVMGDTRFTIVTPSRKRTHVLVNNPFLPVTNVFVAEEEYDTYAKALRNVPHGALLTHNTHGLSRIRNVMLSTAFRKDHLFQYHSDDDFVYFSYLGGRLSRQFSDLNDCLAIILQSALVASDIPCGLFGYSHSALPQEASPLSPFDLRGRINVDFGILDRDLRFDEDLPVLTDADYFLQTVAKYGVAWKDMRFFTCTAENAVLDGGLAHIRTTASTERAFEYLTTKWGSDVVLPQKKRGTGSGVGLRIPR